MDHCNYRHDRFGGKDSDDESTDEIWRFGQETYRARYGDCEDTSILLAEWLGSRGFDVRVAVGENATVGAHAWCVVNLDGVQYLLETTNANPDLRRPPLVSDYADEYKPAQLFDRNNIYFVKRRATGRPEQDYWAETIWNAVDYSPLAEENGEKVNPDPEVGRGWGGKDVAISQVSSSER